MPMPVSVDRQASTRPLAGVARARDRDAAMVRELQRVAQQVEHDLLHLLAIARDRLQVLRHVERDRELRAQDDRLELGLHLADQIGNLERRQLQRHPARFDARDVENLVDDRRAGGGRSTRCAPSCRLTGGVERPGNALQQHRRVAEHRVERRPELVRHVGEELRLQRRRLLELDRLAPQQLVLLRDVGGRRLNLALELVGRLLQLLVQPAPSRSPRGDRAGS